MEAIEMKQKFEECRGFLEQVLKPELETRLEREKQVRQEMDDYIELESRLKEMIAFTEKKKSNKTLVQQVDLGYQKVFTMATVDDTTRIFVNIGMGFHVELTLQEAIAFASKRVEFLRNQVLVSRSLDSDKVRKHIRDTELILDGLTAELGLAS